MRNTEFEELQAIPLPPSSSEAQAKRFSVQLKAKLSFTKQFSQGIHVNIALNPTLSLIKRKKMKYVIIVRVE